MGLIREPKNVDFTVQSIPWNEEELRDFRKLMSELKAKNVAKNLSGKVRKTSVSNKSTELDVDYIGGGKPLTKEDEIAISKFIRAYKAKHAKKHSGTKRKKVVD